MIKFDLQSQASIELLSLPFNHRNPLVTIFRPALFESIVCISLVNIAYITCNIPAINFLLLISIYQKMSLPRNLTSAYNSIFVP